MCTEPAFQHLHFLLQFAVAMFGRCQFGKHALAGDAILGARMIVGPVPAGGLVDEPGQIFVALQEITVHAGSGDDDTPADPAVLAAKVAECFDNRRPLGGGGFTARVGQPRDSLFVALSVIDDRSECIYDVAAVVAVGQ